MTPASAVVFVNGPVQNGEFTLATCPGKAAGIRIAQALNQLLGVAPVPHLWNTVTLAGDLRHRARAAMSIPPVPRPRFERALIAAKYPTDATPDVWTDADTAVVRIALAMVEHGLDIGGLAIETVEARRCAACGHLTGLADRPCRACGHAVTRPERARHLLARRLGAARVRAEDFHAHASRPPAHLLSIAGNAPDVLLLSRTRDHGIGLEPFGLPGLVLDPRAGLHAAVLAAAADRGGPPVERVVMTTTANAAANIAAYGAFFRTHQGIRLRYGLHGRIPYAQIDALRPAYAALRVERRARETFEHWFLPLAAWKHKNDIGAGQLTALLRFFHRARLAPTGTDDELAELRAQIASGDTRWLTDKRLLAAAVHITEAESVNTCERGVPLTKLEPGAK